MAAFEAKLMIDNRDAEASGGRTFVRRDPVRGDVATIAAAASIEDAVRITNSAASAFPLWAETGPSERRAILMRAADILQSRSAAFVDAMMAETGATEGWSLFNVELGADILRDAAGFATHACGTLIPTERSGDLAMGIRQPCGVCLAMAPWNAPVVLGIRAIAMALACGNTVVLKASELCPKTHRLIGDVMAAAGLPPGVVNVLSSAPEDARAVVEALIAHPAIRRINFTGSTRVGRIIAQLAANHLKRCLLELGGKAPFIVLADADVEHAVEAAAFGAFFNQGQICMSTERIIVDDAVADSFIEGFAGRAQRLKSGDPRMGNLPLGSLISAEAVHRVNGLVEDALSKGAVRLAGGTAHDSFMDATVLDHVTPSMRLYQEESFGPVAAIIRAGSAEEAVTIANDCPYGLSAAIFSRDVSKAMHLARRIESGICHINGPTVSDEPQMPFGGVKASGYGRFGGMAAIDEFTELRWITVGGARRPYPL